MRVPNFLAKFAKEEAVFVMREEISVTSRFSPRMLDGSGRLLFFERFSEKSECRGICCFTWVRKRFLALQRT